MGVEIHMGNMVLCTQHFLRIQMTYIWGMFRERKMMEIFLITDFFFW